jgi:hypothetical protein
LISIAFSSPAGKRFPIEPLRFRFRLQNLFMPCPDERFAILQLRLPKDSERAARYSGFNSLLLGIPTQRF